MANAIERVIEIREKALGEIKEAENLEGLTAIKNIYLAKKSELTALMGLMKELRAEEKGSFGKAINDTKTAIQEAWAKKAAEMEKKKLQAQLEKETIDISLPGETANVGHINPYYVIIDEVSDIFAGMGFEIVEGRDVETDHYNFELLNVPQDHPARDMQDTFYISETELLRTQTSAAQAHTMLSKGGTEPIKMICPGKTYRRDEDDMTHSHQFSQIEGLVVAPGVSLADLKGTLELFVKKMFGEKREVRFRSSFFPFTEPSVEVDASCSNCGGKGCNMCKGTGWIEIGGAGEVHPNVLRMCGYNPDEYSGFAFGVGVERIAMLRFGIDDIRRFYTNDIRFIKDFNAK